MIPSSSQLTPLLKALGFNAQFNDNLKLFLQQLTYTAALNDALYSYLESLGYAGELNEKILLWEQNGYPLYSAITVTTAPKLDPAFLIVGNQIQTAFVAGVYSYSSAVTETVFQYTVNGGSVAPTYVLQVGDTIAAAEVRLTAYGIPSYQVIFAEPTDVTDFSYTTSDFEFIVPAGVADVVAPILSAPSFSTTNSTIGDASVTTDELGPMYIVITNSSTLPSKPQIKAGQDHTGAAALNAYSFSVGAIGAQTYNAMAYATGTGRYIYFMQEDISGNQSNIVTSGPFGSNNTITKLGSTLIGTGVGVGTITVDLTSLGLQQNDLVQVVVFTAANANRTIAITTSGYTAINGTKVDTTDTYRTSGNMFEKFMGASPDSSVVVTAPGSSNTAHIVIVEAYRGVNTTTPTDVAIANSSGTNSIVANALTNTPVTNNALMTYYFCGARIVGTSDLYTSSDLSGFNSAQQNSTNYTGVYAYGTKLWHTGDGAFDPAALTISGSDTTMSWQCLARVLRPA